jgi:hypothetical protein
MEIHYRQGFYITRILILQKKYRLMLFLQGRGESGKYNGKQQLPDSKIFLDPAFRK